VTVANVQSDISALQQELQNLQNGTVSGPSHTARQPSGGRGRQPPNPQPRTQVPPSYVATIALHLNRLIASYDRAIANRPVVDMPSFNQAVSEANQTAAAAAGVHHTMATTPILLLYAQRWLDQHNIKIDLHSKFGQAGQQISNQGTNILDNAITILSETANTLLNTALILIISFYLLSDGGRLIRGGLALVPADYQEQVWFFMTSLDKVLGGYIRGQLFLSALAGVLGGGGAAILGVPYPLLIGIMTFVLESIPVIGPMVAVVPAVAISLFFMPLLTTGILLIWFLVFQQIVTNVLGPRIMGMAVGIHPLEAILAVLVGYPIGGLLGAFLAVPVMGIVHILVREAYAYVVLGRSLPTAPVPADEYEDVPVAHPAVKASVGDRR
jgi:predicted PurR-regulated permease PerM